MGHESMFSRASGLSFNTCKTISISEGIVTNNANFLSDRDFQRVFENSSRGDAEPDEACAHRVAYYYGNVYKVINKGNHNRVYNDTQVDYNYDSEAVSSRLIDRVLPDPDSEEEDDHEDDIDDPSRSLLPQRPKPPGTAINDCFHPLQQSPELHDSEVDPLPLPTSTSLSITPSTSAPPAEVPVMEILTVAAETQVSEGIAGQTQTAPAKSSSCSVTCTFTCSRCTVQ